LKATAEDKNKARVTFPDPKMDDAIVDGIHVPIGLWKETYINIKNEIEQVMDDLLLQHLSTAKETIPKLLKGNYEIKQQTWWYATLLKNCPQGFCFCFFSFSFSFSF